MKKQTKAVLAAIMLLLSGQALAVTASSGPVTPGEWNTDWQACLALAREEGTPIMAVWGTTGCHFCQIFDGIIEKEYFVDWSKEKGLIMAYVKASGWSGEVPWITGKGTKRQISGGPGVHIYWEKNGTVLADEIFMGRISKIGGSTGEALVAKIMAILGDWEGYSGAKYAGGSFAFEETEGNRLEAEAGTTEVSFELTRDEKAAEVATNNLVTLLGPDGAEVSTQSVEWEEGETSKTVTVDISEVNFTKDGDQAALVIKDADGTEQATNHVTYVSENSVGNPLWIGERTGSSSNLGGKPRLGAVASQPLAFGEWTMDIDTAKSMVANAEGDAYTLVAVEGNLWCHDCANTTRNFLNAKDGGGNNRFAQWAVSKQVALVVLDIPNFNTNSMVCASPTLLSRDAYTTTLAFEAPSQGLYDVSKGGAPESLTKPMLRSGLGYLTRKGVSDDEAANILERNWRLVSTDTAEGGFNRPEDKPKRQFRTGVPIFVLLRKDGTVAARFTRFAEVSPMADLNWDNAIKRFDEMLEIAKAKEGEEHHDDIENNDASTTTLSFKANGGSASGEICTADIQDVFKLEGVGGNALQKVVVTGACDAVVSVQFMKLDAEGRSAPVGEAAAGKLSDGIALEQIFEESGDFFVKVSGGDIASGSFKVDNAADGNFAAFGISGTVVFVPQEARATGSAADDRDTVTMRLEKDGFYRLVGVDTTRIESLLEPFSDEANCKFFKALAGGDVEIPLFYGNGGDITYQKWVPGKIGFTLATKSVTESVGDVIVELGRADGKSGDVTVRVSLDEEATTLYNSEDEARFVFEPVEFTWSDGSDGKTNVTIKVLDDKRFDGVGDVALKLELLNDENGDTVLTTTNFVLTVSEDDKQSAGKVAFTGADPFFSKKGAVYAKEGKGATIYAERVEASDGYVTAQIKPSSADIAVEVAGVATNVLVWANHKSDAQEIKVTGLAAGKTATLTIEKPTDGLKVLTASNKVTIVSVADDAPEFETPAASATLYRYVSSSNVYPVTCSDGAKLTFTKLSGTLPAGLKANYDETENALAVVGAPTAKPGVYPVVFQVTEQVGSKKTPGLTLELTITIVDPTVSVPGSDVPFNAAIVAQNGKARTIKDIAMLDVAGKRLAGVLTVTIPAKGNVSAKYTCSTGSVSFSAKSWSGFDAGTKDLSAVLGSTKKGYSLTLVAADDGSLDLEMVDPNFADPLVGESGGTVWSKTDSAEAKKGYYTIALTSEGVAEVREGVAPRGYGYLTLKMDKASDWNAGKVKWAGMLPNGTAVSGDSTLAKSECEALDLPIFKRTATDELAILLNVCDIVTESTEAEAFWRHTDKVSELCYEVEFNAYGGHYVTTNSLSEAFAVGYPGVSAPTLKFDIDGLLGRVAGGTPSEVTEVPVTITDAKLSVPPASDKNNNPQGASLTLARSTGIVKGSFKLPYTTEAGVAKTLTAKYQGVLILGWGIGCGCDRPDDEQLPAVLPFVVGSFFVDDAETVNDGKSDKSVKVKRGGSAEVD